METKKVLTLIFSIIFIGAFAFVLTWGIINFNKVKDGMSGTGLYTQEDLNNAYEDGYDTALKDKDAYQTLINEYRDTITNLTDQISQYTSQITNLNNSIKDYQNQVKKLNDEKTNLNSQISSLEEEKETLNNTISENNKKISDYLRQIEQKEHEIENLKSTGQNKESEISNLESQIESMRGQIAGLQHLNSQLETTNQSNFETIQNLNARISTLNAQIVAMQNQYQGDQDIVNSLNAKIKGLEDTVKYYEEYIRNLESGDKIVATFEFNGTVINVQILQKGGKVLFPTPESTTYVVFNYWETESGERVQDTSSHTISESTKFVANITQKFDVKFSVDGTVKESQIVVKGEKPTAPSIVPSKAGYEFDGWTLNGADVVEPTQQSITQTTTFIAKFTQKFTVTFMYENETKSTQEVRSGGYAQDVHVDSTAYKRFNGWKVNGVIVTVEEYEILGATTFIADITYSYDVKFKSDMQTEDFHNTQIIENGHYAVVPSVPTKEGYEFDGWTINGNDIVDVSSYKITATTTFIAKFTKLWTVTFDDGIAETENVSYKVRDNEVLKEVVSNPFKENYQFKGWTLNGEIVNLVDYKITQDLVFVAKYEKLSFTKEINTSWIGSERTNLFDWSWSTVANFELFKLNEGEVLKDCSFTITICIGDFPEDKHTFEISYGGGDVSIHSDEYNLDFGVRIWPLSSGSWGLYFDGNFTGINSFYVEYVHGSYTYEMGD